MTDDHLRHLCKLSSVTAYWILSEDFDVRDVVGDEPPQNVANMFKILAEAFVELQGRADMKPRFRLPVRTAPIEEPAP